MLVKKKKKRHSAPSFQFPKVVLGQPWAAFIICWIWVGFVVGFWLDFSEVDGELIGV